MITSREVQGVQGIRGWTLKCTHGDTLPHYIHRGAQVWLAGHAKLTQQLFDDLIITALSPFLPQFQGPVTSVAWAVFIFSHSVCRRKHFSGFKASMFLPRRHVGGSSRGCQRRNGSGLKWKTGLSFGNLNQAQGYMAAHT